MHDFTRREWKLEWWHPDWVEMGMIDARREEAVTFVDDLNIVGRIW